MMYGHVRVSGPGFKKVPGVEKKPLIMNTELYNLFCSLLGYSCCFYSITRFIAKSDLTINICGLQINSE